MQKTEYAWRPGRQQSKALRHRLARLEVHARASGVEITGDDATARSVTLPSGRDRTPTVFARGGLTDAQIDRLEAVAAGPGFAFAIVPRSETLATRPGPLAFAWVGEDGRVVVQRINRAGEVVHVATSGALASASGGA